MAEYDNNMRGSLWRNDKGDNPNRPDARGSAEIDGVEYWVSCWFKRDSQGKQPIMSLAFEAKDEQRTTSRPADEGASDDLPF